METKRSIPLNKWSGPVTVSWLESVSKVWVSHDSSSDEVATLMEENQTKFQTLDEKDIAVGGIVAAKYGDDWCRAKILNIFGQKVNVLFIDYGNCEEVTSSELKKLSQNLMIVPPAATEVHIEGNEQIINNDENMDVVSENLDKQVLKVKLLPSVENQEVLIAKFAVNDKKLKWNWPKEVFKTQDTSVKEEIKAVVEVKTPISTGNVVMANELPTLTLITNTFGWN